MITQSAAILRYAGRVAGLYPVDPAAALAVDEVLELVAELMNKAPQAADRGTKQKLRQAFAEGHMARLFGLIEQRVAEHSPGWSAGPEITVADLALFCVCELITTGQFDHVDRGLVGH